MKPQLLLPVGRFLTKAADDLNSELTISVVSLDERIEQQ